MTAADLTTKFGAERAARERKAAEKRQLQRWKYEARAEKSAALAEQVSDPSLLILAFRMYCHLPPAEMVSDSWIAAELADQNRQVKAHAQAARRVLLIQVRPGSLQLPKNWKERVAAVGIELGYLTHPGELARFLALPTDLVANEEVRAFAAGHPNLIDRAKRFLLGERPPKHEVTRTKPKRDPVKYKSLHEAIAAPSPNDDDTFYYYGDADDSEPADGNEPEFTHASWLQQRISAFLAEQS